MRENTFIQIRWGMAAKDTSKEQILKNSREQEKFLKIKCKL